jgi:hypothetical protein
MLVALKISVALHKDKSFDNHRDRKPGVQGWAIMLLNSSITVKPVSPYTYRPVRLSKVRRVGSSSLMNTSGVDDTAPHERGEKLTEHSFSFKNVLGTLEQVITFPE